MIAKLIRWSIDNRILIVIASLMIAALGVYSVKETPVDALPDLSDVQVIIKTSFPGQAPQVVEDQVTYPLTTAMLSVPKATTVRGYSFFGDSYVYVIFEDGTDLYWARSRVLEYLNQVAASLPEGATSSLGPDAPAVTISPSCAACRTGSSSMNCRRCMASPKWRRSAAWCASTRLSSTLTSCALSA
jgi:Cu(I)/Ag(I) efflux system membrane protein CusA/SilA